jgi:hypothetical protein
VLACTAANRTRSWESILLVAERRQVLSASSVTWGRRTFLHAPVEHLFLPRTWLGTLTVAPSLREVASWFEPYKTLRTSGRPVTHVRAAPKVGRNEPCACGSGRKSKHCCTLALAAG